MIEVLEGKTTMSTMSSMGPAAGSAALVMVVRFAPACSAATSNLKRDFKAIYHILLASSA